MRHVLGRVELEFQPLGDATAKVCPGIGAKARLNWPRKPQIEEVVGMQMCEFAAGNEPRWIPMRPKP